MPCIAPGSWSIRRCKLGACLESEISRRCEPTQGFRACKTGVACKLPRVVTPRVVTAVILTIGFALMPCSEAFHGGAVGTFQRRVGGFHSMTMETEASSCRQLRPCVGRRDVRIPRNPMPLHVRRTTESLAAGNTITIEPPIRRTLESPYYYLFQNPETNTPTGTPQPRKRSKNSLPIANDHDPWNVKNERLERLEKMFQRDAQPKEVPAQREEGKGEDEGPVVKLDRPTMLLGGASLMMVTTMTVAFALRPSHSLDLVAKMFANSVGGMLAVGVCHPIDRWRAGASERGFKGLFKGIRCAVASQGFLKAMSALAYTYTYHIASLCAAGTKSSGLFLVASASLGTGVFMALVSTPIDNAERSTRRGTLLEKLKAVASHGVMSDKGLYAGLAASVAASVCSFEAFFLSYSCLVAAWPWMGASLAGTALSGALAGCVSCAAGVAVTGVNNFPLIVKRCRDWWRGRKCLRKEVGDIAHDLSTSAVNSSVLFVSYQAVLGALV